MCVFAKVNKLGFIETPYRLVENGNRWIWINEPTYIEAAEEENGQNDRPSECAK